MSGDEPLPDKVVPFKKRDPNALISEFKRVKYDEHVHGRFLINERLGKITCQICGQLVPAFEAFCLLTEAWQRQHYKFKAIEEYETRWQKKRDADLLRRIQKQQGGEAPL